MALGSNPRAARLVGVRTDRVTVLAFAIAGGLGGLSGVLLIASQGVANPAAEGIGLLLPALVAVFLGASAFSPGQFNVPGTMVGLLLIAVLVNGLSLAGVEPWIQPLANGVALIVGIGVSATFRRRRLGGDSV
jgi:ribose transport system permease protein